MGWAIRGPDTKPSEGGVLVGARLLGYIGPAFMFVGFASVFAAISFASVFGLATIVEVLRFQARRIRELPAESPAG